MRHTPKKTTFLDTALQVEQYHLGRLKEKRQTITETATELSRSVASVSRYLKIASWNRTHNDQLSQCDNIQEALALINRLDIERQLRGLQE